MTKETAPKSAKAATPAMDRAERRAAMLKANLKRRKAQKRVRNAADDADATETEDAK